MHSSYIEDNKRLITHGEDKQKCEWEIPRYERAIYKWKTTKRPKPQWQLRLLLFTLSAHEVVKVDHAYAKKMAPIQAIDFSSAPT